MILSQTPNGKIEIVESQGVSFLQFNGPCEEMLPYCGACCCRGRDVFGVLLTEEEATRLQHRTRNGIKILASNGTRCAYLNDDCRCNVHDEKPKVCREWHCSPGGEGTNKGNGWMMLPTNTEAV